MTIDDIYDESESSLRRYAMSLARDPDVADDLVQEALIRALAHIQLLGRLNRHQRRSWLFRVLRNLFIDEQRTRRRQTALVEQMARENETSAEMPLPALSPDILSQVPPRERDLLERRYVLGMNSREIAQELGIPPATVRSRIHLAIKRLRMRRSELLESFGQGE